MCANISPVARQYQRSSLVYSIKTDSLLSHIYFYCYPYFWLDILLKLGNNPYSLVKQWNVPTSSKICWFCQNIKSIKWHPLGFVGNLPCKFVIQFYTSVMNTRNSVLYKKNSDLKHKYIKTKCGHVPPKIWFAYRKYMWCGGSLCLKIMCESIW